MGPASSRLFAGTGWKLIFAIVSDIIPHDRKRWSLHFREIFREKLVLAVPRAHPLAARNRAIQLGEIPREEIILLTEGHCLSEQTMKACRLKRSEDKLECGQIETLLAMISAGMGIGIVPEMTMKLHPDDNITYLQVCDPEPERVVAILRRKAGAMTTAAEAFLKYSREQMISVHKSLYKQHQGATGLSP